MGGGMNMPGMQGMGFGLQNAAAMGARLGIPGMQGQVGSSVILVSNLDEQVCILTQTSFMFSFFISLNSST